ncbi:hypothetical protein ACFWY5_57060 [Nonomuraea sp. NPDC059007]|uniref:hypothetical protein n=1 Tax=Nonomuraea sp. NPDC059007 TaxID=3346692 RepID=UPI0036CE90B8
MTVTETVATDAEIAVTGPVDAAPLTAPDSPDATAPATDPVTDPATDADGRVGAVWAALRAEPGGSTTMIGAAADLSRVLAGKILNQLEADGHALREPGVNDGGRGRAADRWFPITPSATPAATVDTAAPTGNGDAPAPAPETPDAAPDATPAPGTDTPGADTAPAPEEEVVPSGIGSADPAPADEPTDDETDPTEETAGHEPGEVDGDLDANPDADADADADEPESEPVADDPAWARARADLSELADLFNGVLTAKDEGNAVMALGCLEMAMTKVAAAHRTVRAALTGTVTPARAVPGAGVGVGIGGSTRPGGLRDLVHAHLIEFPGKEFTSHEIAKALGGRSSGAVANALDRLVQLGDAVPTTERPRRFALAPTANPAPANTSAVPPANPADAAGDGAAADTSGG